MVFWANTLVFWDSIIVFWANKVVFWAITVISYIRFCQIIFFDSALDEAQVKMSI